MGIGSATGEGRALAATEQAIASPLLESSIDGAHGVLLFFQGGSDLGLFEISEAANLVRESVHPEANIIFGNVVDGALGDEVRVTVIAAGFDSEPAAVADLSEALSSRSRSQGRRAASTGAAAISVAASAKAAGSRGAHAADKPVSRPLAAVPSPVSAPSAAPAPAPEDEAVAAAPEDAGQAQAELEVPQLLGADAETDEIDLPDFLR